MRDALEYVTGALPILPAVVVIIAAFVAFRLSRHVLAGGAKATTRGDFRLQIAYLIISLLAVVVVVVVLPVGTELRGQLLSLFGIVLSAAIALASTTFVGNAMAGVMLKAVRNFRTGDFVQVGEQFGRVTERGLLSTEIQTEDRNLVTLPNLHLVVNPVKVVRSSGTIVSADVSLGYDAPHERVAEVLLAAAETTQLKDPFVLVTNLGDFAVTYRVAGLLEEVKQLLTVRSRLREAMLDHLHTSGIEIVSPNFMNQRVLAPETRVIPQPVRATATAEEVTLEDIAFDKAESAESFEQLIAARKEMQEAIAALDNPAEGGDPAQVERQRKQLTRRLANLEEIIAARQEAAAQKDSDSPS
jgi:small-conductance mechanosensitive channel